MEVCWVSSSSKKIASTDSIFIVSARIRKSSAYASATTGSASGTGEKKPTDEENQAGVSGEKKARSKRHPELESKGIALQI